MRTRMLAAAMAASGLVSAGDPYSYDRPGDRHFLNNTAVLERVGEDNRSVRFEAPRAALTATFTTQQIQVDGHREAAWDAARVWPISHRFDAGMNAPAPQATTQGSLRLLWDGPVLYLLVEVSGDTTRSDATVPAWTRPAYSPDSDGLFVFMDVFNDQWGIETDTQGVFFLGANPALTSVTSYVNPAIPSLGSFFNPAHQDHSKRLKAFAASGFNAAAGVVRYTYEIALQIEGWGDAWRHPVRNGTQVGFEVAIADADHSLTFLSRTQAEGGRRQFPPAELGEGAQPRLGGGDAGGMGWRCAVRIQCLARRGSHPLLAFPRQSRWRRRQPRLDRRVEGSMDRCARCLAPSSRRGATGAA